MYLTRIWFLLFTKEEKLSRFFPETQKIENTREPIPDKHFDATELTGIFLESGNTKIVSNIF